MAIDTAKNELYTKLSQIFGLPIYPENAEVDKKNICYLYVFIENIKTNTFDDSWHNFDFKGTVEMLLGSPCLGGIGYLTERRLFAINQNILGQMVLSRFETRTGNLARMEFSYISSSLETTPVKEKIEDINIDG